MPTETQANTGTQSVDRNRALVAQVETRQPIGTETSPPRQCVGRVGAPPNLEATSDKFHFWLAREALVEKTQIISTRSDFGGRSLTYYAIVDEVTRCSRKRSMGQEVDEHDSDPDAEPMSPSEGITYATATILRTDPALLVPPRERSAVFIADEAEVEAAYEANLIRHRLAVGLVKNGGDAVAGPGYIDTDYLLGASGGHLNVNGAAGRGTKSSFLLFLIWMLLRESREQQARTPSDDDRLRVVPIIFNVKGFDLFFIDRRNTAYDRDAAKYRPTWDGLGISDPQPFDKVTYLAPQQAGTGLPVSNRRGTDDVRPYSWSLRDLIERDLFEFLFAESDVSDANFGALAQDIQNWLTRETANADSSVTRTLQTGRPATFDGLADWIDAQIQANGGNDVRNHHIATWRKLARRLRRVVYESRGLLRRAEAQGNPLDVVRTDTSGPIVIDLSTLGGDVALQRFVVASIFKQLVDAKASSPVQGGLKYLVMLDELNRFAPKGAHDAVTQLIERVAALYRSQGILLFGAQQQASRVSDVVVENAGVRAVGRTGMLELSNTVWKALSATTKRKADSLPGEEKLIVMDSFREPMHVRVPFPVWAMNPQEAAPAALPAARQARIRSIIDG